MSRRRKPLGLSNGHGLYFHSSPPKVFNNTDEFGKIQYEFIRNIANKTNALVIKPSNIRIWIHDKDIDKLMRVVLEGHGHKLRNEVANQPKVKRFLEYVPHFLGLIKGIHQAVVDNNIEILRAKTSPPVPPQMLSCKDVNGLTPLHKAAGLGHGKIVEYLLNTWPNTATEIDNSGKTPLHYAASLKNNERIFNILIQAGADEMGIDGNGHTPAYYKKSKNSEDIDRALLVAIPDAPRVAEQGFPPSFDWNILPAKFFSENSIRSSQSEFNLSHVKENTMKASSSAFEILSRSNSHQMEDESDPKHEQESEREPVTKKSSKKVQRPKTFNKNDVNNNSTKGKEMNDDDDVETGKAVGSETLLPEERLQKQTTSVKSHQSNPEPDHNNDNDNVNLIDNDNDQMTDSKTLNRIDSESQLMENKEIKDENVVDVGETSNEEKLNEISEDNFDEKGQNKDDEKFQETSQKEIEENFQDDNKEKANEKSHEINDEKSLESSQQNDDELNKNVDILILEDSSQDNEKSKDVNDGDNDKEEEEEDKLSSRQQSAASINDHVDNEIGESSEIKEKENSEIKESKTEEEERKVETLDINFEHPPTPAPKNSENNVIDVAENSKEAGESTTKDIDSNGNSDEEQMDVDNDHEIGSPSPPIEGFITEEAEKQLESQGGDFDTSGFNGDINDDDPLQKLINAGDMEQLALLVLNGNGKQLIGRTSNQPDIQAFLDNVQTYVNKIRKVHVAAREGSLRDLQAALDRRKFSTAKDEVSPNGTTPLHVAVIFGHTAIIRYLGSRFQETLSATDEDNRTALHYAATIKDNGHFYNLLVHLGANPKSTDNLGRTAESYLNHDETDKILSHKDLLKAFGAEEGLADEMLNDQVPDDYHSARRKLDDPDVLTTLERCFKLINDKRPTILDQSIHIRNGSFPGSASSLRVSVTSYLAKYLKRPIFEKIKHRQTRLDHNLFDIIWPAMKKASKERRIDEDLNAGVVAPDFDVFVVFQEFFVPLIKDLHSLRPKENFKEHPKIEFFPPYIVDSQVPPGEQTPVKINHPQDIHWTMDIYNKWIVGGFVECCRNLDDFELPLNLTIGKLEQSERIITGKLLSKEFTAAISESEMGQYYTMNEVLENSSNIRTVLATNSLLIPLLDYHDPQQLPESYAINGHYYPYGRGVYVSHSKEFVVWINVQEHLRVLCCTPLKAVSDIGMAYSKVGRAMIFLESQLTFRHSFLLGYLSSRPSFLGSSLRLTLNLELPYLVKDQENLRQLCIIRGLHMKTRPNFETIRVSNTRCMSMTEWNLFQEFCMAISNILQLEKDLSLSNSMHIADMLLKIFRKKKNSLASIKYKNNQPVEIPLFRTEEGRYLATSLGDPLIKGLTEVANQRPSDPIAFLANYLQNFSTDKPKTSSNKKSEITKPEPKTEANETKPKSGKTLIPVKQKSVENFIDDDNTDSTPGSEERDEHGQSMLHFAAARHFELAGFLDRLQEFEENRERLLHAVRHSDINTVKEVLSLPDAAKLARAKNYYGRCSIHIAVLLENEEIVDYLATNFRQTLRTGDNLERTALHYSMGINNVEAISRILIKNGAKRVLKDLKGRTPSFYYINKSDILRLQEEERE
ncbi:CLUMA_CG017287, isoform A [Clunio marinus]|uniref:CLUMA_CG017287, isoform A n=1 Tax=Clunio marinus TaxID=568069 RepID=A0A1J1IV89_9DIPT|nr:CLUMA_CG017287, isoform A [Clunio marinus]